MMSSLGSVERQELEHLIHRVCVYMCVHECEFALLLNNQTGASLNAESRSMLQQVL